MDDRVNQLITEFVEETGGEPGDWFERWRPSYNIRPTDDVPILLARPADRADPDGPIVHRAELARWWLVPSFAKQLKSPAPTFNARSETAAEKPSFRASVVSKRAVLPAIGYYETKTEGSTKTPYFIAPAHDLLYFAGLYSWWPDPAVAPDDPARWHLTATILTRAAVGEVANIHDRTPVTIPRDFVDTWIDPRTDGDAALIGAAVEAATPVAESLAFHRIASPIRGDDAAMIAPA